MRLEMVGLNHTTSSVDVRGRAALAGVRLSAVYERLGVRPGLGGSTVLSTCNRTEIYLSPDRHGTPVELRRLLVELTGITPDESEAAYHLRDLPAAMHLFRVASGLDSQLLGEVQILGQVRTAFQASLDQGAGNKVLNRLFSMAIECGKLVRSRTGISKGSVSVASAAVQMARQILGSLEGARVLLVGAGETARLAARHLQAAGVSRWTVCNRTSANAKVVADLLGGEVGSFPPGVAELACADLIVSATGADGAVIGAGAMRQAIRQRGGMRLLLDLAIPRDTEPAIGSLPDTFVFTVDDFDELVRSNLEARQQEARRAGKLVEKLAGDYDEWYRSDRVTPAIRELQEVLEDIRAAEVASGARRFSPDQHELLDRFSRSLMRKVGNLVVGNMKRASVEQDDIGLAKAVTQAMAGKGRDTTHQILASLDDELSH